MTKSPEASSSNIIHIHIPKTAGTSIRAAFTRKFGSDLAAPHITSDEDFNNHTSKGYCFYSGHFGFDSAKLIPGKIFTILRDPVYRCVSTYRFWRKLHETGVDQSLKTSLAANYSLEDFFLITDELLIMEEFSNRITFQLASSSTIEGRRQLRLDGFTNSEVYNLALTNLKSLALVGHQHQLHIFEERFKELFDIEIAIPKINVTKLDAERFRLTHNEMRAIYRHIELDLCLFFDSLHL